MRKEPTNEQLRRAHVSPRMAADDQRAGKMDGGAFVSEGGLYAQPRVAGKNRTEVMDAERRCACGKRLNQYNRGDSCYTCDQATRR